MCITKELIEEFDTFWQANGGSQSDALQAIGSHRHTIAVHFGNFHYQVSNGGIKQYIRNHYSADGNLNFLRKIVSKMLNHPAFEADEKALLDRFSNLLNSDFRKKQNFSFMSSEYYQYASELFPLFDKAIILNIA